MLSASVDGQARSYAYNGDGVLVATTSGSTTTRYTQDLAAPLSQVLGDGSARYIYGHERLLGVAGGNQMWYGGDALGSVRLKLDETGASLGAISYDPWGNVESGSVPSFGFTGELHDTGLGLVNLRARWYTPGSSTLLGRDPFVGMLEQPYSLHYYQYAYSDPVLLTDPSGKWIFQNINSGPEGAEHDQVIRHYALTMWGSPFLAIFGHVEFTIGDDCPWPADLQELYRRLFPGKGGIYSSWSAAKFNLDIINTLHNETYEVKMELRQWVASGIIQSAIDNAALNAVRSRGLLRGAQPPTTVDPRATPGGTYDWNGIFFHLGITYPDRVLINIGPDYELWAGHKVPGLIVYWHEDPSLQRERKDDPLLRPVGYIPRHASDGDRPQSKPKPPRRPIPIPSSNRWDDIPPSVAPPFFEVPEPILPQFPIPMPTF